MLKPLIGMLVALCLICPVRAYAQPQPAPDTDTVGAAMELITALRITDQFKLMLPSIFQTVKPLIVQGRPEIERDFDAVAPMVLDSMIISSARWIANGAGHSTTGPGAKSFPARANDSAT
jgi:hypothetical protein